MTNKVEIAPATRSRWKDIEVLAGERGFFAGCWCMWWRETSQTWTAHHGDGNRAEFKALVDRGDEPGLLAYEGSQPIGWIAIAPRSEYPRLDRSPKLKPVDDEPVWSITCFYIDRHHRRQGVATELLTGAIEYARSHGAEHLEAYPIDAEVLRSVRSNEIFTGSLSMFVEAGFREVARRGGRPIVRLAL